MSRKPAWSWTDVKPAAPSRRRLNVHVDAATYQWLQAVAREKGESALAVAAAILSDVAADDIAAHGGGR